MLAVVTVVSYAARAVPVFAMIAARARFGERCLAPAFRIAMANKFFRAGQVSGHG
jgi:hypothetical protein